MQPPAEAHRQLLSPDLSIIFIMGHGDVPLPSVEVIKSGAIEFDGAAPGLEVVLLSAIDGAIERSRASLAQEADLQVLRDRYESLTTRERQVLALIVRGQLNKQVGFELWDQRDHSEDPPRAGDGLKMAATSFCGSSVHWQHAWALPPGGSAEQCGFDRGAYLSGRQNS